MSNKTPYIPNLTPEESKEKAKQYAGYQVKHANDLIYREPANDQEKTLAKKIIKKNGTLIALIATVFTVLTIACFVGGQNLPISLLLAGISLICILFAIKTFTTKPQVIIATAVNKESRCYSSSYSLSMKQKGTLFYVYVIPENDTHTIYQGVTVNLRTTFEAIQEGTKILVIKTGATATGVLYE